MVHGGSWAFTVGKATRVVAIARVSKSVIAIEIFRLKFTILFSKLKK